MGRPKKQPVEEMAEQAAQDTWCPHRNQADNNSVITCNDCGKQLN